MALQPVDAGERYSVPAFTKADAWNTDCTLARYIAAALRAYMSDNGYDPDVEVVIGVFTSWAEKGSWDSTEEEHVALDDSLLWLAINFKSLWT